MIRIGRWWSLFCIPSKNDPPSVLLRAGVCFDSLLDAIFGF
jgi:hypothetical protein